MAYRTLELTLISAKDLSNVNIFTKMEVYAWAYIAEDPRSKKRTPVDKEGGRNPTWNFTVKFNVPEYASSSLVLDIVLKSERALGDRDVGEVHVLIRELLESWHRASAAASAANAGDDGKKSAPTEQFLSYQVRKTGTGKAKGVLNISYKFSDVVTVPTPPPPQIAADPVTAYSYPPVTAYPPPDVKPTPKGSEPVTAYPVTAGTSTAYPPSGAHPYPPPSQAGYGYPPPQQAGYGYPPPAGYPPQGGYGYPPQQGGYGYPPQQGGYGYPPQVGYGSGYPPQGGYGYAAPPPQQQAGKKKNKMGLGLGAGLLGGALGGMILGDMISDTGSYDAGYDAGYDDGFGF